MKKENILYDCYVASAHKNTRDVLKIIETFNIMEINIIGIKAVALEQDADFVLIIFIIYQNVNTFTINKAADNFYINILNLMEIVFAPGIKVVWPC